MKFSGNQREYIVLDAFGIESGIWTHGSTRHGYEDAKLMGHEIGLG
jgi:hypothetical protein